jgi:hypothetical protein
VPKRVVVDVLLSLETQELAREKICARAAHGLTTVSISEIKRPVSIDLRTEVSPG